MIVFPDDVHGIGRYISFLTYVYSKTFSDIYVLSQTFQLKSLSPSTYLMFLALSGIFQWRERETDALNVYCFHNNVSVHTMTICLPTNEASVFSTQGVCGLSET